MKGAKLEVTISGQEQERVRVGLGGDEEMYLPLLFEAVNGVAKSLDAEPKTLAKALYDAFVWLEKREEAEEDRTSKEKEHQMQDDKV